MWLLTVYRVCKLPFILSIFYFQVKSFYCIVFFMLLTTVKYGKLSVCCNCL